MHLQTASRRESGVEKCWLSFWFSNQTVELWGKYLLVFVFEVFAFWMIIIIKYATYLIGIKFYVCSRTVVAWSTTHVPMYKDVKLATSQCHHCLKDSKPRRISSWNDEKSHDFVRFLWPHLVFFSRFHAVEDQNEPKLPKV